MMDIDDLKTRLGQWAEAVVGGMSGRHLGLPSVCPYLSMALKSPSMPVSQGISERDWKTDVLVRKLGERDAQLRLVIEMTYLGRGLMGDRVAAVGMARRTYYRRLEEAHEALLALFHADRAA